ncbi:non-heme iron oxygenase ferredoxin subunit [candidate division KSB1 bacterium]|nr:non-heme iron oxygenase ferredoxin subunit [candidate division KSB1 bacterium]
MAQFVKVASASELAPGAAKQVEVNGKTIALFNLDGNYYAIDNTCTHRGGPLAEGFIEGESLTCPWHGAQFNIKTGDVVGPPAAKSVTKYNVRVQGDDVEVEV